MQVILQGHLDHSKGYLMTRGKLDGEGGRLLFYLIKMGKYKMFNFLSFVNCKSKLTILKWTFTAKS